MFLKLDIQVLLNMNQGLLTGWFPFYLSQDFSVVLRARKRILECEQITISYVPPVYGLPKRKLDLANERYFDCSCARCSDVTEFGAFVSALKCSSCREGLILPEDQKKGKKCHAFEQSRLLLSFQDPYGDAGSVQTLTKMK